MSNSDSPNPAAQEPVTYPVEDERNANADQARDNHDNQPDNEEPPANRKQSKKSSSSSPSSSSKDEAQNEKEEAARKEREAIAELEARLPRPDWYTSDDEESVQTSEEDAKEISDLKVRAEGGLAPLLIFTILVFICFVFNLASSCPIPWMKGKGDVKGREFGVWLAKKGGLPDLKVNDIHDCSQEMQYWQTAAAFSVMSTVASFGALLCGILLCAGVGHLGAAFALSFYSMAFSLVSWALVAHLYGYNCCNKYTYKDRANLGAGFALTLIAFVLMLVAIIVLGVYFLTYYTRSVHTGVIQPMRFVYFSLLIVVAVLSCVGPAYTQWKKKFEHVDVRVTMWHIELEDRHTSLTTFLGRKEYKCSTFTRRMKVVAAFNILGNIWLAFAIFNATAACYNEHMRTPSNIFGWMSVVFALVGWITLLATRHGNLCTTRVSAGQSLWHDMGYNGVPTGIDNAQINYDGYSMGEGFALMVTGWAVNVVACILNGAI